MLKSLRSKLIFSHLAVIFVAMLVTGFLLLSLGQQYFLSALEHGLTDEAHLIAQALIPDATIPLESPTPDPAFNAIQQQQLGNLSIQVGSKTLPNDLDSSSSLADSNLAYLGDVSLELSSMLEARIRVLDNRGIVLVDSSGGDEGQDFSGYPAVATALQGTQQSYVQKEAREDWIFVLAPVLVNDQVAGVIFMGQPLRDVTAVLSDLRLRLLLASIAAMALSAIVGLTLARTIARPVQELTVAADKISAGDYNYPLQSAGQDELGQLERTFVTMRQKLQAVEKMRVQFVSDVSHELRTPLTAVKGLAETLRDGAVDDSAVRDHFLASIEGETDRLIRLVNDLLILSRADSQKLMLRSELFDLGLLAGATIEKMDAQAAERDVNLEWIKPGFPLMVHADPDRIEQVLVNLLDNAIKHTPAGHLVQVMGFRVNIMDESHTLPVTSPVPQNSPFLPLDLSYLSSGEWIILSVADTGQGIPPQDLPHVFERFYRTDYSRSRDRGGSGLGLSIAQSLIQAHGGQIWIQSPARTVDTIKDGPGTISSFAFRSPSQN